MKIHLIAILVVAGVFSQIPVKANNPLASDTDFGIGVMLGEPTGISLKKWISNWDAIDAGIGWAAGPGSLNIHADYLHHFSDVITIDPGEALLYIGPGVRVRLDNNGSRVGVRFAFGFEYIFDPYPVDIFLEVVPILDLVPDTTFQLNAGLGARFYFSL